VQPYAVATGSAQVTLAARRYEQVNPDSRLRRGRVEARWKVTLKRLQPFMGPTKPQRASVLRDHPRVLEAVVLCGNRFRRSHASTTLAEYE
jgi:hypothetical protein